MCKIPKYRVNRNIDVLFLFDSDNQTNCQQHQQEQSEEQVVGSSGLRSRECQADPGDEVQRERGSSPQNQESGLKANQSG